jgi:hypothetical protein
MEVNAEGITYYVQGLNPMLIPNPTSCVSFAFTVCFQWNDVMILIEVHDSGFSMFSINKAACHFIDLPGLIFIVLSFQLCPCTHSVLQ